MKLSLQYVHDIHGNTQAVQLSLKEWKKVVNRLKKYEQALKLKADIHEALEQVAILRKTKEHKQTLNEFLNEV